MPNFEGKFFSIVFIGKHNPQIINHDFLINNGILPISEEPFKSLLEKRDNNPFTEFISTPVLASIKYESISITIEGNRYQIKDTNYGELAKSPIISITKKYFGEILRYTPLQIGGINLSGVIKFIDNNDEQKFDENLGISKSNLCTYADTEDIRFGISFTFPWLEGLVDVQISKLEESSGSRTINLNYEFKNDNMENLLANLDKVEQTHEKFRGLLQSLGMEESA